MKIHNFFTVLWFYIISYSNYIIVNFSLFFKSKVNYLFVTIFILALNIVVSFVKKLLEILITSQKNEIKYKIW